VGFTIGSRGEVPGKRKPMIRENNNNNNNNNNNTNNNNNNNNKERYAEKLEKA
jgi:hypothetical protein